MATALKRSECLASPREDFQDIDFSFYFPKAWFEAIIASDYNDDFRAHAAFFSARTILGAEIDLKAEDARTIAVLAQVEPALAKKNSHLREAQHAMELMPISKDIYDGGFVLEGLAQVYTWTTNHDRAIEVCKS